MAKKKGPMDPDDALWQAITREKRPTDPDTLDGIVATLERAGLTKKDIASRLGVSARTVQRWSATTGRRGGAKPETLAKARDLVRTAPEVRRQHLSTRREARVRNQGSYVRISGKIGKKSPGAADGFSGRDRTIGMDAEHPLYLDGEQIGAVMDAYLAGDDEGAWQVFSDALSDQYFGGVEMRDITAFDFLRDYGGERPEM